MKVSAAGVVGKVSETAGRGVTLAIDKAVERRYDGAVSFVDELRRKRPSAEPAELADEVIRRVRKELVTVGATMGGAAAVPGAGIGTALATAGVDITATFTRIAEMVMRIGACYGHDRADVEERRLWVLTSLIGVTGAQQVVAKTGVEVSKGLGAKAVGKVSGAQLRRVNAALGRTVITKYGTKRGAIALGRAAPFGIGAIVGGGANHLLVTAAGKHAKAFFDEQRWSRGPETTPGPTSERRDEHDGVILDQDDTLTA